MDNCEKEDNKNNNNDQKEDNYDDNDFLDMGNLNINQEIDIKENPKKHIADTKKLNFLETRQFSENSEEKNKKRKKNITYEDIYLGNDMFSSAPKSYPRDYEKNCKLILSFTKKNKNKSRKSSSNERLIDLSQVFKKEKKNKNNKNEEDENEEETVTFNFIRSNSYEFYGQRDESMHLKDFLISINNHRKTSYDDFLVDGQDSKQYIDEDEKVDINIFYIENEKDLNNLNYYTKKNKCNIKYISLDLFIKKICTENLKDKYPTLYKSFIDQYQEFLSVSTLTEKIISALNYYHKKINIEIPDLIFLLNKIISNHFKEIEDNEELVSKLRELYQNIEEAPWINEALQKEIENINFILSSNSNKEEFDLEYTRYLISDRKRTKGINIRSRAKGRIVNNKNVYKYPYFYIFDFSDEEIAKNLTLISFQMMSSIDVNELWNGNFSKEDKLSKAPNVTKLIERFDKLMLFIIEDICSYETNKARAKAITRWANIAKKCKDFHNYNDLLIINQCFSHYLLKKLIATKKKLPQSTFLLIAELNKLCLNQQCYVNIRREIAGCKHRAYIPYLGILLKEVADIEQQYKYLEKFGDYNLINCIKLQKIYTEVKKFFAFKNFSFSFTQINELKILNQLNPKTPGEIEAMINENEKNNSTLKEFLSWNSKRRTKTDEMFYC